MSLNQIIDAGIQSKTPRPFPGKYPTRVRISSELQEPWVYQGKPVPANADVVGRTARRLGWECLNYNNLRYEEFDQNGWILRYGFSGSRPIFATYYNQYFPMMDYYLTNLPPARVLFLLLAREIYRTSSGKLFYGIPFFYEDPSLAKLLAKQAVLHVSGKVNRNILGTTEHRRMLQVIETKFSMWSGWRIPTPLLLEQEEPAQMRQPGTLERVAQLRRIREAFARDLDLAAAPTIPAEQGLIPPAQRGITWATTARTWTGLGPLVDGAQVNNG
jgi:hypothetical protein